MKTKLFLFLITILFVINCDNTVNSLDQENGLYSVYGVLVLNDATNTIRIRDLKAPFTLDATREIDAEVTLENLDDGTSEMLVSERLQRNGVYHHNFQVQNILPDTGYELTIKRSDGRSLELRRRTPSITTKTISPANRDCKTQIEVEFGNINGGDIEYVLSEEIVTEDEERGRSFYEVFYTTPRKVLNSNRDDSNSPISFTFRPSTYHPSIQAVNNCNELEFDKLYITYIYYSEGLYEKIGNEDFDPLDSIERFGGIFIDTLEISFDISSKGLK